MTCVSWLQLLGSAQNILILNLAVSNVLLCVVTMPLNLVNIIHNFWVLGGGQVSCDWWSRPVLTSYWSGPCWTSWRSCRPSARGRSPRSSSATAAAARRSWSPLTRTILPASASAPRTRTLPSSAGLGPPAGTLGSRAALGQWGHF